MQADNRFVWIDLEMTGLDPNVDVILEISCLITDDQLNVVAQGPSLVIKQPDEKLAQMIPLVRALHDRSGLTPLVRESQVNLGQACTAVLDFIQEQCIKNTALLCGNSVWQDRRFLQAYMPEIVNYLHYRMIDVSVIKECVRRWYPKDSATWFVKKESHRALDDILESIEELRYYRHTFFIKK